ncbi:MAG: hypothetical protein U0R52_01405 [Solirubrobacterales bacterium]
MKTNRSTSTRLRTLYLAFAMALGALAILALPGIASAKDRNHDRIPDRWEKRHHLSLKVKQTKRDQDRDGLNNLGEFNQGTNPRDADTDNDGIEDGAEVEVGDDPTNQDSDDDGIEDGAENAGTVASFDGTTLVIDLAAGGSVSGQVTDRTEVRCESADDESDSEESGSDDASSAGRHANASGSHEEGGDDPSGDDEGESGGHGGCDNACSVDDLVAGATVHEAELHVNGDGAVFEEVQLIK